jgi:preprotein translocase subunit SecE
MAKETRLEAKAAAKKKPARQKQQKASIREYFRGIKTEVKKVVWPTRKELSAYTVVVILTCTFFALGFWAIDTGVLAMLKGILGINM